MVLNQYIHIMYIYGTDKDTENQLDSVLGQIQELLNLGVLTKDQTQEVDDLRYSYMEIKLDI